MQEGCSTKVEFLALPSSLGITAHELDKGLDGSVKWESLPDLHFTHAYTPAVAYVKEKLYVVGGGDFDLTTASDKVGSSYLFLLLISFRSDFPVHDSHFITCMGVQKKAKRPSGWLLMYFL